MLRGAWIRAENVEGWVRGPVPAACDGESVGQVISRGSVAGCPPGGWGASSLRAQGVGRESAGLVFGSWLFPREGADDVGQVGGPF